MISINKESLFYPRCIYKELIGLNSEEKISRLGEVPHQVLVDLLKALKHESSNYKTIPLPLRSRIEMVESVINTKYGNAFSTDEAWKTWWILPN